MTRPRSKLVIEREKRIKEALNALKNKEFCTVHSAARHFEVSHVTLGRRWAGGKSMDEARESQQLLTSAEEKALAERVYQMTVTGHPPPQDLIREIAHELRQYRLIGINDDGIQHVNYEPIGQDWVKRFIKRHPRLKTVYSETIEASRVKEVTYEGVEKFYNELRRVINEFKISPENCYNMDETGSSIGTIQGRHVVVDTTAENKYELEIGRQEWVTCIECICTDGSSLSPTIIFKGTKPLAKWIPESTEGAAEVSWKASENGWISNDLAVQWLREVFEPQTREKANGGRRLIICDGHDSHISAKFVAHCMHYKIEVVLLTPHSSHLLQPLDVAVFGPLKTQLSNEQRRYIRAGVSRLQKWEWADCYLKARQKAITDHNIKSGWRASGCHPIFPAKVLDKLPPPLPSESDSSTSNNVDIADIPLSTCTITRDTATPIRQSITAKINHLAATNTLDTPARQLIPQITLEYEIALVTNKILRLELKETRDVLAARKERQKGKRTILKGQHHITTRPNLKKIKMAEAETQKSRRSRKKDNKKKELLDVIEVLSDDDKEDDEEIEQA